VWGAVVRTLAAEGCLAWPAGPLRARLRLLAVAFEGRVNPVWPMPGAAAVLRSLAGRGLPLGLVSNAQCYTPWFMQAAFGKPLRRLGLRRELLVWSYALGEAKPAAALFGQALTRLRAGWSIAPREVLYVGNDALKDVAPAQRAGCRTAFFAGDARSCRPSPGVKADIVLTALDQLPELVGRI
jgi:putative hydrolase of the HAD superfamily